jgi:hypothetical protein
MMKRLSRVIYELATPAMKDKATFHVWRVKQTINTAVGTTNLAFVNSYTAFVNSTLFCKILFSPATSFGSGNQ